jgi:hypothetical protein
MSGANCSDRERLRTRQDAVTSAIGVGIAIPIGTQDGQ